jgi:effector-binding domain-containing protein
MKTKLIYLFIVCLCVNGSVWIEAQETEKKCDHSEFLVKEIDAQKTLVIKANVPSSEIGTKMGEMYGALYAYLQTKGIAPAGAPFAVYYSFDPSGMTEFEAGIPVAEKVEGNENISAKEFPVMKVVSTLYSGAYENMAPVYESLMKYMTDNKLESAGTSWEVYLTDPSLVKDPSENKTLIYFPVKQ